MLVLSRRAGETITIGGNITVIVVAINGHRVKLGIEAPPDVKVHREEVLEAIRNATTVKR